MAARALWSSTRDPVTALVSVFKHILWCGCVSFFKHILWCGCLYKYILCCGCVYTYIVWCWCVFNSHRVVWVLSCAPTDAMWLTLLAPQRVHWTVKSANGANGARAVLRVGAVSRCEREPYSCPTPTEARHAPCSCNTLRVSSTVQPTARWVFDDCCPAIVVRQTHAQIRCRLNAHNRNECYDSHPSLSLSLSTSSPPHPAEPYATGAQATHCPCPCFACR